MFASKAGVNFCLSLLSTQETFKPYILFLVSQNQINSWSDPLVLLKLKRLEQDFVEGQKSVSAVVRWVLKLTLLQWKYKSYYKELTICVDFGGPCGQKW